MKRMLLLVCFALSVPTLAGARTNISVKRVLQHLGLPQKIKLEPQLKA